MLFTLAYNLLFQALSIGLVLSRAKSPAEHLHVTLAIGLVVTFIGAIAFAANSAVTGAFISGGLIHLFLKLVGGTDHPFEVTFRVVCYAFGSTAMYQMIPICGGIVAGVANLVTLIIGMYAVHETSGGKAAAGVLLPNLVFGRWSLCWPS